MACQALIAANWQFGTANLQQQTYQSGGSVTAAM